MSFSENLPLHKLNWHALQYALYIKCLVQRKIRSNLFKNSKKIYPPCVAVIQADQCGNINYGYAGKYLVEPKSFYYPLSKELKKIGGVGNNPLKISSKIGNCAETAACNSLLNDCNKCKFKTIGKEPLLDFKRFKLSSAYRPRTAEWIKRCEYCCQIFGDEN